MKRKPIPKSNINARRRRTQEIVGQIHQASWSGPLPPPALLEHYELIQPGFAKTIVSMAEKEQNHHIDSEKKIIEYDNAQTRRGQNYAITAVIVMVVGAVLLGYFGMAWPAGILGGSSMAGIIGSFITAHRKNNSAQNNIEK